MGTKREVRGELGPLQTVFLKRVQEEMKKQGLLNKDGDPNGNALSKRVGAPPQTTINDALRGADPKLSTVQKFATALGLPAIALLTEAALSGTVHNLPTYPQIKSALAHSVGEKIRDRKKRSG